MTGALSRSKVSLTLDLRIIDSSTGQIVDSVNASGSASSNAISFDLSKGEAKVGSSSYNNSPLGAATRQAIASAVYQICTNEKLNARVWEARIADLDTDGAKKTLYIASGSASGIKVGDTFTVFHPGRAIVNPETHVIIGRTNDSQIGHCRIESVMPDLAVTTVSDGDGFAKGDLVRFTTSTPAP